MSVLTLALPSKGRLLEATAKLFAGADLSLTRSGAARSYRGQLEGFEDIEIVYLSSAEIADALKAATIDLGVTGEDLLSEAITPADEGIAIFERLGFGHATVVVAVPVSWLDVAGMSDLDEVSEGFYTRHGRRLRVATKYVNLTRRFFAEKGVVGYRIVESFGATEGAPAAGTAEAIVDITTTGATLAANRLKVLDDGVILDSQAVLAGAAALRSDARVKTLAGRLAQAAARNAASRWR